jgi:His/Glu/Gln/Arg/opine family amino acid ABC transporter permease subunit
MGMVLGLFAGLGKLSSNKILYYLSTAYIDFFRGTPLFVQIFLLYFGVLPLIYYNDPVSSAIIALGLNSGAYIGEIVRAGIQAVDQGQMEAARSLGMNQRQAMTYVILPQAFKIVIPADDKRVYCAVERFIAGVSHYSTRIDAPRGSGVRQYVSGNLGIQRHSGTLLYTD